MTVFSRSVRSSRRGSRASCEGVGGTHSTLIEQCTIFPCRGLFGLFKWFSSEKNDGPKKLSIAKLNLPYILEKEYTGGLI